MDEKTFMIFNDDKKIDDKKMYDELRNLGEKSTKIDIAVAFFSSPELLIEWAKVGKDIRLLISLSIGTNPKSITEISKYNNVKIKFFHHEEHFHSKYYIFKNTDKTLSIVLGSSNFSRYGLKTGKEANILLLDDNNFHFKKIEDNFSQLWDNSDVLTETVIKNFSEVIKKNKEYIDKLKELKKKIFKKIHKSVIKINYNESKKVMDEVVKLVKNTSVKEWPDIPFYITVDHFWHWIVAEVMTRKDMESYEIIEKKVGDKKEVLPILFKKYADWDKDGKNYTDKMFNVNSKEIKNAISEINIDKLTIDVFIEKVCRKTNALGLGRTEPKIIENDINNIKKSIRFLLYPKPNSSEEIEKRIKNMLENNTLKIKGVGPSFLQELPGWVYPYDFPPINLKSIKAMRFLGFDI